MSGALRHWVNGEEVQKGVHAIGVEDRGLQYGDGLFETMLLRGGRVRFLSDHLARLRSGCTRLAIEPLAESVLQSDLDKLCSADGDGIIKLIITRGLGGRGYRAPTNLTPTRVLSLYAPVPQDSPAIEIRWCNTRLARNGLLAGMKHLNRLEQVLAQTECAATECAEGLMLDTEGELVCATSANVFAVIDGVLVTPDLRFSGVLGVMRKNVIAAAGRLGIAVEERALWPAELEMASEMLLTNAVRAIRRVHRLEERTWDAWPVAQAITAELRLS